MSQIITLYVLNIYTYICQLFFSKVRKIKIKKRRMRPPQREKVGTRKEERSKKKKLARKRDKILNLVYL